MSIARVCQLQPHDLRQLGGDLPARVASDRIDLHAAVNRSLAIHDEQLTADELVEFADCDGAHEHASPVELDPA